MALDAVPLQVYHTKVLDNSSLNTFSTWFNPDVQTKCWAIPGSIPVLDGKIDDFSSFNEFKLCFFMVQSPFSAVHPLFFHGEKSKEPPRSVETDSRRLGGVQGKSLESPKAGRGLHGRHGWATRGLNVCLVSHVQWVSCLYD